MMPDYPTLSHLLGAYLHQDFLDEFRSPTAAVEAFLVDEPASRRALMGEIDAVLRDERFLASPDSMLLDLGCYYNTHADGLAAAGWLSQVRRMLQVG